MTEKMYYTLVVRLVEESLRPETNYTDSTTLGEYVLRLPDIPLDRFKRMVAIANGEES